MTQTKHKLDQIRVGDRVRVVECWCFHNSHNGLVGELSTIYPDKTYSVRLDSDDWCYVAKVEKVRPVGRPRKTVTLEEALDSGQAQIVEPKKEPRPCKHKWIVKVLRDGPSIQQYDFVAICEKCLLKEYR